MNKKIAGILLLGIGAMGFISPAHEVLPLPAHFPPITYNFEDNQYDKNKVKLGRALFFDPILSKDNSTSCASCHSPYNSFAHTDHDLSHGINDEIGNRNAPALFNLAWHSSFMWDGAVHHLDMQALAPIEHPKELGTTLPEILLNLDATKLYPSLFFEAYGDSTVTGEKFLKSLSQFQLTLISADSKYDRIQNGEESFSDQEEKGYKLFRLHCASCHTEPLFTNGNFENNGLPIDTTLNDTGRMDVTQNYSDAFKFKVPSLRNLDYSYPYMHDGRFHSLSEILQHYTIGISNSPTLAEELQEGIELSDNEKTDLISFLITLNDENFVFNPEHQFPRDLLLTTTK